MRSKTQRAERPPKAEAKSFGELASDFARRGARAQAAADAAIGAKGNFTFLVLEAVRYLDSAAKIHGVADNIGLSGSLREARGWLDNALVVSAKLDSDLKPRKSSF